MATKPLPAQEVLNQLLSYDPETGKLFWKERPVEFFADSSKTTAGVICRCWNKRCSGKEAIHTKSRGYLVGPLLGDIVFAHRVIWKMVYGYEPNQVDHESGNRSDNRLINLRDVNDRENGVNKAIQQNNTSGITGVHWEPRRLHWRVVIQVDGKQKHIGSFDELAAAAHARKEAQKLYGYHENHGRPAA